MGSGRRGLEEIRDEILTKLVDWLKGGYTDSGSRVIFTFSGMDYPLPLTDKARALAIILGKRGATRVGRGAVAALRSRTGRPRYAAEQIAQMVRSK